MTINSVGNVVERTLELASKGQIAQSTTLINEPGINQTGDVEMCRLLFKSHKAMREGSREIGIREALLTIKHLERSGYKYLFAWIYSIVGISFGMLGSPEVGLEWVNKALASAEDRSNESQMQRSLSDQGFLLVMLDKYDEAIAAFEKALHLRENPIPVNEETWLLNGLAEAHLQFARWGGQDKSNQLQQAEQALDRARTALRLIEPTDNDRLIARSFVNMGSALSLLTKYADAEDLFKKALPLAQAFPQIQVELLCSYASMLCDLKRFTEANEMLTQAYDQIQSSNLEGAMDRIFEVRVRFGVLSGQTSDALLWSEQRTRFLENRYRESLAVIARNAEIFIDVERTRLSERRNKIQTGALAAIQALGSESNTGQGEMLNDPLTGCLNRRGFKISAEAMFVPGGRAALAIVDTDNFKSINDRYGHEIGDKVLRAIGKIFSDSLRNSDLVAHYDGEEFMVLLHGIGPEIAWGICERLRLAVEHHGWGTINSGLHVTVSVGLAAREHDEVLDTLTVIANDAVSRAKSEGSNRVIAGH